MARTRIERDWSLLPAELLHIISSKVESVGDYLRFAAVCQPWRSAASSGDQPRRFPHLLPWLLLPYQLAGNGNSGSSFEFYDLSESKTHRFSLPEMQEKQICGSSFGWFVLLKGQEFSLFNPLTRAAVSLPPLTAPPDNLGFPPLDSPDHVWDPNQYSFRAGCDCRVIKAVLTSNPLLGPDCMVLVLFQSSIWDLAFCRIGDENWTVIEFGAQSEMPFDYGFVDFTHSNGSVYASDLFGSLTIYNLKDRSKRLACRGLGLWDLHLVQGDSEGEVLVLYSDGEGENPYTLYKLRTMNGETDWFQERDIGQNMLFWADSHAISLPLKWRPNCLCYGRENFESELGEHRISLARIEDGRISDMTSDLWVTPKSEGKWQKCLWLAPSLI
ncbi:hypothetical protein LUZ60_008966 [Juncus effusus]|nr:hypothetical protein LUZ60_008966 [Juncus effusus]